MPDHQCWRCGEPAELRRLTMDETKYYPLPHCTTCRMKLEEIVRTHEETLFTFNVWRDEHAK